MPKPIPEKLLATYAKAFEELRQSYREGRAVFTPAPEIAADPKIALAPADMDKSTAAPLVNLGPCEVMGNSYRPKGELFFKPIPEIAALLAYLEETP